MNGIYKELAEHFGVDVTIKFYEEFNELQLTFPVRLLSKEYVKNCLNREYNGQNLKDLSKKYGYTERWLRTMLEELNPNYIKQKQAVE